jgi:hypothetical protein
MRVPQFSCGRSKGPHQSLQKLSLALLVLRIAADHAHHAAPVDHLAFVANLFYRCPNFHFLLLARNASPKFPGENFYL